MRVLSLRFAIIVLLVAGHRLAAADEEVVRGTGFELTIATSTPAAANRTTEVSVVLTPTGGYKVNQEFPIALQVKAPGDVDVPRAKLGKADARVSAQRAEFRVPLTPRAAGEKTVTFSLRFAVCTDKTCEPRREVVGFKLRVR